MSPGIAFLTDEARSHFLPTILFALAEYPGSTFEIGSQIGGDDGPGMAWVFGLGLLSAVSSVVGILLVHGARGLFQRST